MVINKYLHFHRESLNEPLHLRCGSYLHEQNDLSHTPYAPFERANVKSIQ